MRVLVDKFLAWLNSRWRNPSCTVCGENNWHIGERPLEMKESQGVFQGEKVFNFVPVTCNNFGNTLLFNSSIVPDSIESENILREIGKMAAKNPRNNG